MRQTLHGMLGSVYREEIVFIPGIKPCKIGFNKMVILIKLSILRQTLHGMLGAVYREEIVFKPGMKPCKIRFNKMVILIKL